MRWLAPVAAGLLSVACSTPAPAPTATPTAELTAAQAEPTAALNTAPPVPPTARPVATPGAASAPLVEALPGALPRTLHPYPDAVSYTPAWLNVAALIWGAADGGGALLAFDWQNLAYRPAMAADMPVVSGDARTYTFSLRDGLRWSDGAPIRIDDFQFAYDQASRDENRYVQLDLLQEIATFNTRPPNTIEVTFKEVRAREVALAVANLVTPVPKHIWNGRAWTDAAANPEISGPSVVLGPFRLQSAPSPDRATFVPVDTFDAGKPRVPRVDLVASAQAPLAYDALKTGAANWMHGLPSAFVADAQTRPELAIVEWLPANATYRALEFNLTRPFLADRRVRQALAYALDRQELLRIAEQGRGVPQYGFVQPANARWATTGLATYEADPARARQLLLDAGYTFLNERLVGKDRQPIKLQLVYPTSSTARARIADLVQQRYRQLGIELDLVGLEFGAYTDQIQNRRDFDLSLATYGGGAIDPDLGPRAQLVSGGTQNVTGYANPQVDELFRQAAGELDPGRRKRLYDQAQALVNADVPLHYLYAVTSIDAFSRKVRGVDAFHGDRLDADGALLSWSVDQ